MIDLKLYEYKAPSYELVDRNHDYTIDEKEEEKTSRFQFKNGMWHSKAGNKSEIKMIFAGDLLCQEKMLAALSTESGRYDFKCCFEFLRPLFKAADFVAGNLETPVDNDAPYRGEILTHEGPFFCNAPVEYLEALKYAGFDMLTTANNHTLDAGVRGLDETVNNCRKFNFIQTGTFVEKCDKFVVVDICGIKVGFTAFGTTYNLMQGNLTKEGKQILLNTYTAERAEAILKKMKNAGAEYTICFPHWGVEYTDEISDKQMAMAEELSGMGYDLIAGSHSHVVQKYVDDGKTPTLFSLGNLISHMNLTKNAMDSQYPVLMAVTLKRKKGTIESTVKFIPCRIFKEIEGIPFTVIPANNNLKLTGEYIDKLKLVPAKVAGLLMQSSEIFDLHYPVDVESRKYLNEFLKNVDKNLSHLKAGERKEPVDRTDIVCTVTEKADFVNKIGKYKLHSDFAEMMCMDAGSTVVKINREIKGKPVKVVNNGWSKNRTARILYMGKFVEVIGKNAFSSFEKLESVRFFENTKRIEEEAFYDCAKLTGIVLPMGMEFIGERAFANCPSLLSIKIPDSVSFISENAFEGCEKLRIYCNENSYADVYAKNNNIPVTYMPV